LNSFPHFGVLHQEKSGNPGVQFSSHSSYWKNAASKQKR
jgi:hypothetical protein